jgi:hypothetical protein
MGGSWSSAPSDIGRSTPELSSQHREDMTLRTLQRVGAGLLALTLAGGIAACGDDDDDAADATTTSETDTTEPAEETVEVTAVDYAFEGFRSRSKRGHGSR